VQPDALDQAPDLRLGAAQHERLATPPESLGECGKINDQRRVGKHQVAHIYNNVALRSDREHQRPPTQALGAPVLIAGAQQNCGFLSKFDDSAKLLNRVVGNNPDFPDNRSFSS
jgi:hypothetical protein